MLINLREYHRPDNLQEASRLLAQHPGQARALAGGTHLVASGDPAIESVIDLSRLGLDHINVDPDGLRIGAMVRLQRLIDADEVQRYADGVFCRAAAGRSVSRLIRNAGTLGGELVAGGPFSALAAAMLALDAEIQLHDDPDRTVSAMQFVTSKDTLLSDTTIITDVVLPSRAANTGCDLQSLAVLSSSVPLLSVAVSLRRENQVACTVRIALAGGFAVPARLIEIEEYIESSKFGDRLLEGLRDRVMPLLDPPADMHSSSEYRRQVAPVLIGRALRQAWLQAGGEAR